MEYPPGWSCEVVVLRLEHYVLGTIPRDGALAVAEHLEACEACAHRLVRHSDSPPAGRAAPHD